MKFYDDERARWPAEFAIICRDPAKVIARLDQLFPVGQRIKVRTRRKGSCWSQATWSFYERKYVTRTWNYAIEMIPGATWGEVAHEFAHILDVAIHGDSNHNRRLAYLIDTVLNAVNKRKWIK